jgi:thiol-disulfide isomerase/thioredoxin
MRNIALVSTFILVTIIGYSLFRPGTCFATFSKCPTATVEQTSQIAPHYLWYTQQNFEAMSHTNDKIVLFFYAPWCGTCSVLDDELIKYPERLDPGITVLKVEYDKDRVMKDRYGVVVQHTLVLVDHDGKELRKWIGGDIAKLNHELL